jgi:hypothetical protein
MTRSKSRKKHTSLLDIKNAIVWVCFSLSFTVVPPALYAIYRLILPHFRGVNNVDPAWRGFWTEVAFADLGISAVILIAAMLLDCTLSHSEALQKSRSMLINYLILTAALASIGFTLLKFGEYLISAEPAVLEGWQRSTHLNVSAGFYIAAIFIAFFVCIVYKYREFKSKKEIASDGYSKGITNGLSS